ncbi:MAG: hypothetical protein WCK42_06120 [Myxococcaceae bacterium]
MGLEVGGGTSHVPVVEEQQPVDKPTTAQVPGQEDLTLSGPFKAIEEAGLVSKFENRPGLNAQLEMDGSTFQEVDNSSTDGTYPPKATARSVFQRFTSLIKGEKGPSTQALKNLGATEKETSTKQQTDLKRSVLSTALGCEATYKNYERPKSFLSENSSHRETIAHTACDYVNFKNAIQPFFDGAGKRALAQTTTEPLSPGRSLETLEKEIFGGSWNKMRGKSSLSPEQQGKLHTEIQNQIQTYKSIINYNEPVRNQNITEQDKAAITKHIAELEKLASKLAAQPKTT